LQFAVACRAGNAFIEVINSRLRQEFLYGSWFQATADIRQRKTDWRIDYNEERPHSALGNLTPSAFVAQLKAAREVE
jgi:putative transposase